MTPDDLLFRGQQKLVDTMLTADLIYLSRKVPTLALVGSDQDLWPGLKTAVMSGSTVIHIHPRSGESTPLAYSAGIGPRYVETSL